MPCRSNGSFPLTAQPEVGPGNPGSMINAWMTLPSLPELTGTNQGYFGVAACLDGLENGSHVSITEAERARLAIECVANIEQWRGDARLTSRLGD